MARTSSKPAAILSVCHPVLNLLENLLSVGAGTLSLFLEQLDTKPVCNGVLMIPPVR